MPVVDAHHHVWDRARTPQPWIDPGTMAAIDRDFALADLPGRGVDATVVVQSADSLAETRDLLSLPAPVAGVVGWVDILGDVATQVAALRICPGRLVGVRSMIQGQHDPAYLDRPDVRAGIAAVGDEDLAFDLVVRHDQLDAAALLVEDLPHVRFVLDHLGKPPLTAPTLWTWQADLARIAASPNVVAKLSGLATEANHTAWTVDHLRPAVEHALDVFGARRLMFGSDWPVCLLATDYERWLETVELLLADCSDDDRADIWGGTAVRSYRLTIDEEHA